VVDGRLTGVPKRIHDLSTEVNEWDQAELIKKQWEEWQQLTDPNPTLIEDPTLEEATKKFVEDAKFKNLGTSTLQDIDQHFRLRLKPFCDKNKITHIRLFENARTVRDCVGSWRTVKTGQPLGAETRRAELERFRSFLSWCVANGWLKTNHAKAKDLSVRTAPTPKKFGFLPDECSNVFDAIGSLTDSHGRTGQRNAQETYAFCLVMRHTGLRISDVVKLDATQLVSRATGNGWAIQVMAMKKTKEYVRIPITLEVYEALKALPFKGSRYGKDFWFYTGVGSTHTSV